MNIFNKRETLKKRLASSIRQREYLALHMEELKARNRGLKELIKIYEAICLVLGEEFIDKLPYDAEEKNRRLSLILKLLTTGKADDAQMNGFYEEKI